MLSRLWLGVLFALAVVLAPRTAAASQVRLYHRGDLEDAAGGSTHVVVGRFIGWAREANIGSAPFSVTKLYGDVDVARIRVEQVLAGPSDIESRTILVSGRLAAEASDGAVLFLRRERDRFWIVNNSLFRTRGEDVLVALAPRAQISLAELTTIVEPVAQERVTWTARIADRARAGGTLPVVFIAKNESSGSVGVLPPSRCSSVKAYPLGADKLWHAEETAWHAAPAEWFRSLDEAPVVVMPGAEHEFSYEIPLASMNMDWAGDFDVVLGMTESFCIAPRERPFRALPNYMPDRVLRVTVDPRGAPAAPLNMTSVPPAYSLAQPQGGCAATTTSTRGAVTRAVVFGVVLIVAIVVWRRRHSARRRVS